MNEVNCLIKEKISKNGKDYYVIQEIESKEEHHIPNEQIEVFNDLEPKGVYKFFKNYNPDHKRFYFDIINPKYLIGTEMHFQILGIIELEKGKYFELKSAYFDTLLVKMHDWQNELSTIKCKVIRYNKGKPELQNTI